MCGLVCVCVCVCVCVIGHGDTYIRKEYIRTAKMETQKYEQRRREKVLQEVSICLRVACSMSRRHVQIQHRRHTPPPSLPPHRLFGMLLMLYLSICLSVCLCIKNPLHRFFSLCLSLGLCHARLPLLLQAYPDPQHLFGQWPKHEILIPRRPPRRTGERVTSTARTR